jgi:predicted component of type VI protein secretion system
MRPGLCGRRWYDVKGESVTWERRVVWTEGMFLRPALSAAGTLPEFFANARCGPMASHAWGFDQLMLDSDALARQARAP